MADQDALSRADLRWRELVAAAPSIATDSSCEHCIKLRAELWAAREANAELAMLWAESQQQITDLTRQLAAPAEPVPINPCTNHLRDCAGHC